MNFQFHLENRGYQSYYWFVHAFSKAKSDPLKELLPGLGHLWIPCIYFTKSLVYDGYKTLCHVLEQIGVNAVPAKKKRFSNWQKVAKLEEIRSAENYMESVKFELFYTWVSKRSVVPTLQYKGRKVDIFSSNFKLCKKSLVFWNDLTKSWLVCFKKRKLSNEICDLKHFF